MYLIVNSSKIKLHPQYNSHIQINLSAFSNSNKDIVFVKRNKYYIQ